MDSLPVTSIQKKGLRLSRRVISHTSIQARVVKSHVINNVCVVVSKLHTIPSPVNL